MSDMTSFGGNGANRPATGVSWYEAAAFVNWLNSSTGHQPAYNLSGASLSLWPSADAWQAGGENLYRHKDAYYFLPSENEWYKAAYFDGVAGVYYNYPTGSDSAPGAVAGGTGVGTAVYAQRTSQGPADIANAGGLSPYGTMGQGGRTCLSGWRAPTRRRTTQVRRPVGCAAAVGASPRTSPSLGSGAAASRRSRPATSVFGWQRFLSLWSLPG